MLVLRTLCVRVLYLALTALPHIDIDGNNYKSLSFSELELRGAREIVSIMKGRNMVFILTFRDQLAHLEYGVVQFEMTISQSISS